MSSYTTWVWSGGARVVPIPYDAPLDTTRALLKQLNGAVFTGGGTSFFLPDGVTLTQYATTAQLIYNESIAATSRNETWPVWGTCLGFELLLTLAAGNKTVLSGGFDSEDLQLALKPTAAAATSRLWGTVIAETPDSWTWLTTENITENLHTQGVTPAAWAGSPPLVAGYRALSTNQDRAGREFVSSFESIEGAVYGTQFHPEKNAAEWTPDYSIPHTYHAVFANSATQRFFVNQARRNFRNFSDAAALSAALIENTPLTVTGGSSNSVIRKFGALYMLPPSAPVSPTQGGGDGSGANTAAGVMVGVVIAAAAAAAVWSTLRRKYSLLEEEVDDEGPSAILLKD